MRQFHWVYLPLAMSGLLLAFMVSGCTDRLRGMPPSEGIANFGRVNATLMRGAQPDEHGIENLRRLGVATIINLRMADDAWPEEAVAAGRQGIAYVNVPMHGLRAPTDAEVARVLALLESLRPPVFLHCEHGADRTGTIIACYRMSHDHWTIDEALAEARRYGLSGWQLGMKRYVRTYGEKLAAQTNGSAKSSP